MSLLSPAEARGRLLAAVGAETGIEHVPLAQAAGRTLAADLSALRTQPPFASSAMDGYAVRAADLSPGSCLTLIGQAAAGHPFAGRIADGQAVRIFTGAPVPDGADTILIQENVERLSESQIRPLAAEVPGRFVRSIGLDFAAGDRLLVTGLTIGARHLGLAASMGLVTLPVRKLPRFVILSTGDELVPPGASVGAGQIISSNALALSTLITAAGGKADDFGIVPDRADALRHAIEQAAEMADVVVTCGGASVGEHDLVQPALLACGFSINVWKVALRPGKPLILARRGATIAVGLPGNPVSSLVCAVLFIKPLIARLLGRIEPETVGREPALLGRDLPANDWREDYLRATLARDDCGRLIATPFAVQDSSIQRVLALADALLVRAPRAPAARTGDTCDIIRL